MMLEASTCREGTVLNAPWFVLALVVTNAMGLSLSPVFSFSSSPLLRRPFLSLSWFLGEGLSPFTLVVSSKNPQGRLRRKRRAVVPNVDFTSSAGCMLESTRMDRVKWSCH